MKMKKLLTTILASALIFCIAPNVHAEELSPEEEWEYTTPLPTFNYSREASWGKGQIKSSNPVTGYPKACAITSTYSGSAYKIWAEIDVVEKYDDGSTLSVTGPESTSFNSSSVTTNYLTSRTKKCKFIGHHKIWSTSSSGYQAVDTVKDYNF